MVFNTMLLPTGFCIVVAILQVAAQVTPAPIVDVSYASYQGYYNDTSQMNIYKGIRYAAPPVGELRWQRPQAPSTNRSQVIQATEFGPTCPQSGNGPNPPAVPAPTGDEDCLFLSVYAPADRTNLPVFVWIHGGGYGAGDGTFDFTPLMIANGNTFVTVTIQYRLGAFGFLSSAEVAGYGVPNAGIYDMHFALEWVRDHISKFGGDPDRVTIAGESAGGGAVMLLGMAYGGEDDRLFEGVIASSPYLPTQWDYADAWPTISYDKFAEQAGCSADEILASSSVFDCLVQADTILLQDASANVSADGLYGQWAFIPVTDKRLIPSRPSKQLLGGKVNGDRILATNNANEGATFVPRNITTEAEFVNFVLSNYPRLTEANTTALLELYAVPDDSSEIYVDSDGINPPFSTTNSQWAVGWQQAAYNFYAETTFICSGYWLGDAYALKDGKAWRYQYSVPPAPHGADLTPLLVPTYPSGLGFPESLGVADKQIWGNFIVNGEPGLTASQVEAGGQEVSAASVATWPPWGGKPEDDHMLNLNVTGGLPLATSYELDGATIPIVSYVSGDGADSVPLLPDFKVVQGWTWENGRGKRCELLAELGDWILE
ncbi:carboxylesterase family protein [Xylariomycetidae sp. FL2044]|nr:carboxylesterase family protein [Xylariomycetidae sp. FL2044]